MNKIYTITVLVATMFILVSFSTNPPDGKTGAPGDSLCSECHSPSNPDLNGTISVEGFPSSIVPGETYPLTVVNRNTVGDAVRAGFQMTILSQLNTKAGEMANASSNSTITNFAGRQYFEHNPAQLYPDSNVVKWTVNWTAPTEADPGSIITWYAAGNIANGNFQNTGDHIVAANGSGAIVLTAVEDLAREKPAVYPNPGADHINIVLPDGSQPDGQVIFFDLTGQKIAETSILQGHVQTPEIPSGIYILDILSPDKRIFVRWMKI